MCPALGPIEDDEPPVEIPRDWNGNPFTLLPEIYVLDEEELQLAERYRNNDISGGYLRSQIAAFRAPNRKNITYVVARRCLRSKTRFADLDSSYLTTF